MWRKNKYILLFLGISISFSFYLQTKDDLKKQKSTIEKEISYTTNLLNRTKENKSKTLSYWRVMDKQISNNEN